MKKSVKEQGDIWVVAKTLKAFNRLRVAWEEDYGTSSIPVEPPPARWVDCSESDWVRWRGARGVAWLFWLTPLLHCNCYCYPLWWQLPLLLVSPFGGLFVSCITPPGKEAAPFLERCT